MCVYVCVCVFLYVCVCVCVCVCVFIPNHPPKHTQSHTHTYTQGGVGLTPGAAQQMLHRMPRNAEGQFDCVGFLDWWAASGHRLWMHTAEEAGAHAGYVHEQQDARMHPIGLQLVPHQQVIVSVGEWVDGEWCACEWL